MGEEVAQYDGAYKVTRGLWKKYGDKRVIGAHCTRCTHCTLHTAHCTLHTLHTAHCTHYTMHTAHTAH